MNRTLQVEELEYFGKPVSEFPTEVERKQAGAFMRLVGAPYGTVGLVHLLARVMVERRRLKRRAGSTLRRLEAETGPDMVKETIAKGARTCEFRFYRAGTALDTESIDGVPVEWNAGLNR